MNRKLHNTLLALSTTGLVLVAGLLVSSPLLPAVDQDAASDQSALRGVVSITPPAAALQARALAHRAELEQRVHRFEVELGQVRDGGDAMSRTAGFVADIATTAAMAAAIASLEAGADAAGAAQDDPAANPVRRPARSAFATPYFSFAHGLRQANGA